MVEAKANTWRKRSRAVGSRPSARRRYCARAAPRSRREHEKVGGDEIQDAARRRASQPQRHPHHHPQQRRAAALALLPPTAPRWRAGPRRAQPACWPSSACAAAEAGISTPWATGSPARATLKRTEPFGSALVLQSERLSGTHRLQELRRADPPARTGRAAVRFHGTHHLIEQQHARNDRRAGKVPGKRRVLRGRW